MNMKKKTCWFHVLYLIGFLYCNQLVNAQLISPGGTFTTTYSFTPTFSSSIIPQPQLQDYCELGKDNCDQNNAVCTPTGDTTFNCTCNEGLTGVGTVAEPCQDIDECIPTSPCPSTATCKNNFGSYQCICNDGYENAPQCTDINECSNSTLNDCNAETSNCINTAGSYTCRCKNETTANYRKNDNGVCVDVLECDEGDPCGDSVCTNTVGSYICGCEDGYAFDSLNLRCDEIDECANGTLFTCPEHTHCNNTIGSYECIPDIGYRANTDPNYPYHVIDINECVEDSNICHQWANCANTEGSYECSCRTGYSGNGTFCADVNECTNGQNDCDANADCNNTIGSYTCACKDGFVLRDDTCYDINECETTSPCPSTATCENSLGSYSCICNNGYENSPNCTDVNECLLPNNCHEYANCTNTDGSYTCHCKDGFTGSGTECEDQDECSLSGFCASAAICTNGIGNFTCECATGYSGDGRTCTDDDECASNPCDQNCVNIPGSYRCSCESGYNFVSPHSCSDIDECQNANICPENADCINSDGSYKCQCKDGFLQDVIISADKLTTTSVCVVDNFADYDGCNFVQNEDTDNPSRLVQISEGMPFSGVLQYDFYICINGFISIQFDLCYSAPSGELGGDFFNGTLFAPFFTDVDLSIPASNTSTSENRLYYCKYTKLNSGMSQEKLDSVNSKIQEYVRETTNLTNYVPRNSIVATWYKVVPFKSVDGSDYFNQDERSTFQAVITSDGANTVVYYIYHDMRWSDDKGFPVMVGSRYNPEVSLIPDPEPQYSRLRFDKADFVNANGKVTTGRVSFQVSDNVKTNSVKLCDEWYESQPSQKSIASLYNRTAFEQAIFNGRETDCPCTLTQIFADMNFAMEYNPLENYIRSCHAAGEWQDETVCNKIDENNNACFKKRFTFEASSEFNFNYAIGTRCCYMGRSGSLDDSDSESGETLNTQNHFIPLNGPNLTLADAFARDVDAHRYCCLQTPLCERYDERTRVPTCSLYSPPTFSAGFGDPHIMSLDGVQYTFNGLGDYWLLTTNDTKINLDIQTRTCQAISSDGSKSPATVFCGFAFKEKGQPTFEIYHNSSDSEPEYYVNGVKKPLATSSEVDTAVIKSTSPTGIEQLSFVLPSGTTLTVLIFSHFLQAVVSASATIERKTVGLLGNLNGISIDDFSNRFTEKTIPVSSNEEKIYYDFGQSWKVFNEETLFSMEHSANLSNGYTPLFWTNVSHLLNYNQTLIDHVRGFCGDENTNKECYFDFAVTGDEELAADGKHLIDDSKAVIAAIGREVPHVTGPQQINATKGVPMNFTITATSNSTNLTYFIITNFTNTFTLLDKRTGLVNVHLTGTNETITVGVIDEFLNAGILRVKIIICDCNEGVCVYDAPELLANVGHLYNHVTQCQCKAGYTGFRCESFLDQCIYNPCFPNVQCYQNPNRTSYCDPCPSGYSGDGRQCYDIDDCLNSPCEHLCHNTIGDFSCSCRTGYELEGRFNCTDVDECYNSTVCDGEINTECSNTEGSYKCICKDGYRENSTQQCEDIDECTELSAGCQHKCQNTPGSYVCSCNTGTSLNADNHTCSDNDECKRSDACDPNAKCTNTYGSYICECKFGYVKNGTICQDVDECDASVRQKIGLTTACEQDCTNLIGSYKCSCDVTTTLSVDKHKCVQKINPCLEVANNPCDANAACSFNMTTNDPSCTCNPGYTGNGTICTDKNECDTPNICGSYSICTDTIGSYKCGCIIGYKRSLDKTTCEDINECVSGTASCPAHSTCSNTQGSFVCVCDNGYIKKNDSCIDNDECANNNGGCDQVCTNKQGGPPECSCNNGYSKDPRDPNKCEDINECVTTAPCDPNAKCKNEPSTYKCTCNTGYSGNGTYCSDVNECADRSLQSCTQNCTNTIGSYHCSCRTGYELQADQETCNNINECLTSGLSNCDLSKTECKDTQGGYFCRDKCPGLCNQNCNDTETAYKCYCQSGYKLSGKYTCQDINECDGTNDCHSTAICTNLNGTYDCSCPGGFSGNGETPCIEIDECLTDNGGCHSNATCNNTVGSFTCKCLDGFDGDGKNCVDQDECSTDSGGCHDNATCTNLIGSFGCKCNEGFGGDGKNCTDVNECLLSNGGCHDNATCTNTIGSHKCRCDSGFQGNGTHCDDIDECLTDHGGCHANATCTNIPGFRICKCLPGFDGANGLNCVDRNECLTSNGGCHANATCKNNVGSHACECKNGFVGDGTDCDDVDECSNGNGGCHVNATCSNTIGSFLCTCRAGYKGDGVSCQDANECDDNNGGCDSNAKCTNTIGSRECSCRDGFTGNGISCTNVDECAAGLDDCHINATCTDTPGSFECNCKSGFDGDGTSCVDRDECLKTGHSCHAAATCTNKIGGYQCECKKGYSGDGQSCENIDECASNNGDCHVNATCTDTIGSRICNCTDGFSGNGKNCEDINYCLLVANYCDRWANCINNIGGNDTCVCKDEYEGDGKNCYQIIVVTEPDTIPSPTDLERVGASVVFYDVALNGGVLDVKASADNLRDITSSLSKQLISILQPIMLHYFSKIDPRAIRVVIYAFVPLGTGVKRRDPSTSGAPRIQVDYAVDFNVSSSKSTSKLQVDLFHEVNKTDFIVNTREFFGRVVETSLVVADVNPCTSMVDTLKHQCDENAICTNTTNSYYCTCNEDYAGDGFDCTHVDTDTNFLVAIIATIIGLLLLIILLIVFLVIRKRKRDGMEISSASSTSDVSWTPGVFGGMRARSMYTPAGVQPRQYTEYPPDDR